MRPGNRGIVRVRWDDQRPPPSTSSMRRPPMEKHPDRQFKFSLADVRGGTVRESFLRRLRHNATPGEAATTETAPAAASARMTVRRGQSEAPERPRRPGASRCRMTRPAQGRGVQLALITRAFVGHFRPASAGAATDATDGRTVASRVGRPVADPESEVVQKVRLRFQPGGPT